MSIVVQIYFFMIQPVGRVRQKPDTLTHPLGELPIVLVFQSF